MSPSRSTDVGSCTRCVVEAGKYCVPGCINEGRKGGRGEGGRGEEREGNGTYLADMRVKDLSRDAHFDCFHHLAGRDDDAG